jgi:hypothetical protein
MPRLPQSPGERGSQKWIQLLVNRSPQLIDSPLLERLDAGHITWLSPLQEDDYAEYRDQAFLDRLYVILDRVPLSAFWPSGGPVWDGLARTDRGQVILVEAKAHIPESISLMGAKAPQSVDQIQRSLDETKAYLRVRTSADWTRPFYQYANRLAHLYLLRVKNGIDAYVLMLYFVNAAGVKGPRSVDRWLGAIEMMDSAIGVSRHRLKRYCLTCFVDVGDMREI